MNFFKLTVIIVLLLNIVNVNGQCEKEEAKIKSIDARLKSARNWNDDLRSYNQCKIYNKLACKAKSKFIIIDGNKIPVNKQSANLTEDDIRKAIDGYNKYPSKKCGELKPLKALYSTSIGDKKDKVVGYWITKDKYYSQVFYPFYSFYNNGNFKNSTVSSFKQKSSWKKITENKYKITTSYYSDYEKAFKEPTTSTFTINPGTNKAVFEYTNSAGKKYRLSGVIKEKDFIFMVYQRKKFYLQFQ